MTVLEIVAQVFGFLAFAASVSSFQLKTYRRILWMQTVCAAMFLIHFFLLYRCGHTDALTGTALNMVTMTRDIILLITEKTRTQKKTMLLAVVFSVLVAVIGMLTWQSWASLVFVAAMVLNTVAMSIPDPNMVRIFIMLSAPLACVYDVLTGSIGGTVNEIVSFFSALLAYIRERSRQKQAA